jgi:hypothetical protein
LGSSISPVYDYYRANYLDNEKPGLLYKGVAGTTYVMVLKKSGRCQNVRNLLGAVAPTVRHRLWQSKKLIEATRTRDKLD